MKYTIAVDFDGVLHSYTSGWQGADAIPDPPVEGAIDWLSEVAKHFDIVIHTTRAEQPGANEAISKWLYEHGFVGNALISSHKKPALMYIDDRAWRFEGVFPSIDEIHKARPWNHSERSK